MDKIKNTTIAPRIRRSAGAQSDQYPTKGRSSSKGQYAPKGKAASGGRSAPKGAARRHGRTGPAGRGSAERRGLVLTGLTGLVIVLLAANLYFLFSNGLPSIPRVPRPPRSTTARNAVLAAVNMPFASPAAAETSAAASAIEYSTDIDDLSGYSLIVNKDRILSPEFAPADLESPDVPFTKGKPKGLLRREAALAYRSMQRAALAEGVKFDFYSGYRDYDYQDRIYKNATKVYGLDWAVAYSAPAGASEHQTGLAVDISSAEMNDQLDDSFGATRAGKWLAAHCAEYGFILRYPKGKESATGYSYEPWHFRYVGIALARAISGTGLVLEEFLPQKR